MSVRCNEKLQKVVWWLCKCECGNKKEIRAADVIKYKSCGCLQWVSTKKTKPVSEYEITLPEVLEPGTKIFNLTLVERVVKNGKALKTWLCQCACGKSLQLSESALKRTRSYGCYKKTLPVLTKAKNIEIGSVHGKLTVIKKMDHKKGNNLWYECQCSCGSPPKEFSATNLRSGNSESCGCLHKEQMSDYFTTHGMSGTQEYDVYRWNLRRERKEQLGEFESWTLDMEKALRQAQPVCVVCGGVEDMHTDHVRPLVKGFRLEPGNACRLDKKCNLWKAAKDLDELPEEARTKIVEAAMSFEALWHKTHPQTTLQESQPC